MLDCAPRHCAYCSSPVEHLSWSAVHRTSPKAIIDSPSGSPASSRCVIDLTLRPLLACARACISRRNTSTTTSEFCWILLGKRKQFGQFLHVSPWRCNKTNSDNNASGHRLIVLHFKMQCHCFPVSFARQGHRVVTPEGPSQAVSFER